MPIGLASLISLPLILLLHLVRRRRRSIPVPSLELWQAGQNLVQRKPRRLPLTLLLLLHLLVAAMIALALGRPLLPGQAFAPTNTIVVLDTSSSMATADARLAPASTRFGAAQTAAAQIFNSAHAGDRVALVALSATPRMLGSGGPEAAGTLSRAVEQLKPGGPDGDLGAALALANAAAKVEQSPRPAARIVVLTDPSFGTRLQATAPLTINAELDWRAFGAPADNVAIVAFATRPLRNGGQQLYARVANLGSAPAARSLDVLLDGSVVQAEQVRLEPGTDAEWSWPLPADARVAEARLTPGDSLTLDDSARSVLSGGATRHVQLVSAAPTPLERALRAQPGLDVVVASPSTYQPAKDIDLVVFENYLPASLPDLPTLIVAPPHDTSLISTTGIERDLRADVAPDQRFAAIDLRAIRIMRASKVEPPAWAGIMLAAGDTPLVMSGHFGNQPRTIWTFDPTDTNLAGRLAFPLITAATLQTLLPRDTGTLLLGSAAPDAMQGLGGDTIAAGATLVEPGLYRWVGNDGQVAVNAIDPDESMLLGRERPAINEAGVPATAGVEISGQELWRYLIAAALALLLLDWLYSHRHELARRRAAQVPRARRAA